MKLAQLAKLSLSEEEVRLFAVEMAAILDYVEQLKKVDVKGLEPTYQITGLKNVTRSDEIRDYGYAPKDLLLNVPATKDNQIKVKRVLT